MLKPIPPALLEEEAAIHSILLPVTRLGEEKPGVRVAVSGWGHNDAERCTCAQARKSSEVVGRSLVPEAQGPPEP